MATLIYIWRNWDKVDQFSIAVPIFLVVESIAEFAALQVLAWWR